MARRKKKQQAPAPDGTPKKRRLRRPHPIQFVKRHSKGLGKGLLVFLVLVVCAVPVPFVNNAIGYVPLMSVVCLVLVSFVYLQVLKRSLSFSEDSLLPSCERGSDIEFVVNFQNSSPLLFTRLEATFYISDLFGDIDVSIPASMPLMPREKRDFRFEASFDHIGIYNAGVEKIVISDLLGLFTHTILNANRHTVRVLPKLFDIEKVELEHVSVQETRTSAKPIVTDDMDYAGVRSYEIGDPLKNIHWNLSARNPSEEYLTRLFEVFGNPGVCVVMDTCSPQYSHEGLMQVFDGVVESALSVSEYARARGMDVELSYMNKAGERSRSHGVTVEDSDELIDAIPRIHVEDSFEGAELLRLEGSSIYAAGNIAYCTAHLDDLVISTLIDIKNRQHNPLLYLVVPRELEGHERRDFLRPLARLDEAQVPCFVISSATELGEEV